MIIYFIFSIILFFILGLFVGRWWGNLTGKISVFIGLMEMGITAEDLEKIKKKKSK